MRLIRKLLGFFKVYSRKLYPFAFDQGFYTVHALYIYALSYQKVNFLTSRVFSNRRDISQRQRKRLQPFKFFWLLLAEAKRTSWSELNEKTDEIELSSWMNCFQQRYRNLADVNIPGPILAKLPMQKIGFRPVFSRHFLGRFTEISPHYTE